MIIHSPSYSFRRQLHSLDLPLQETHLTPTAPRERQSPNLTSRNQNLEDQGLNPLPGEGQVLHTAVATDISPGHTLSDPGETGTICTAGLKN